MGRQYSPEFKESIVQKITIPGGAAALINFGNYDLIIPFDISGHFVIYRSNLDSGLHKK